MKKFSFLMAVALFLMGHAYVYGAQLNPYAYDVKAQLSGTNIELSYKLNAPATSTDIIVYCNDVEIGRQQITEAAANTAGSHAATVNLSSYNQAGNCTVGILVHGTSPTSPTQISTMYSFWSPRGVAIDKDPLSPNFGRILTNESATQVPNTGYHSSAKKNGIYAFDPTFNPIYNGSDLAFQGGYTFSRYVTAGSSVGNAFAPNRIRISDDGRIFMSVIDDHYSSLYEVSADLQTWTPIFNGTFENGVMLDGNGDYITGMNCGFDVKGSGANLKIIMLNCNHAAYATASAKDFMVATYNLGTATSWSGPATTADTLKNILPGAVASYANCGVTWDNVEGFWYIANRSSAVEQRSLAHFNNAGEVDYELHATAADTALFRLIKNKGLNGGGNARIINNMLFMGTSQAVSSTGHLLVFDITHGDNNVPILTSKYDLNLTGIGRNLNDFDLDPANNLYTAGNNLEKIVAVALPYSGEVETPVALPSNVVLPLTEHLYEIGSNNNWATNEGVEMDIVAPNVFEKEITFADATSYFTLSSALGADWAAINDYRYGADNNNEPISNGLVKSLHLGWGNSFAIPAGKYRITADLNALTVTVKQLWDNIYGYTDASGSWVLDGLELTKKAENVFEGEFVLPEASHILFAKADADNWGDINNAQIEINTSNDYWVNGNSEATIIAAPLTPGQHPGFLIKAGGKYKFNVNLNTNKIVITQMNAMVEVTDAGYATYYNGVAAYEMPTGMKGYVFNVTNRLEEVYDAGEIVPAATPLVLGAAEGTYDLVFTTGGVAPVANSLLVGSDEAVMTNTLVSGEHIYYGLSLNSAGEASSVGFYWMAENGAAFENGAHKAFLAVPVLTYQEEFLAPARILFNENGATGIENVEGQEKAVKFIENGQIFIRKDGVVYDAMGRVIR